MELLTTAILKEYGACRSAIIWFNATFGEQAPIPEILTALRERDSTNWEAWTLGQSIEMTEAFLAAGADVHAYDDDALYWAARYGRTDVVKLLFEKGNDVHANNDVQLYYAAQNGHTDVVKLLLEHGADVHAYGDAAFRLAAHNGHIEVVKLLLEKGANVHANGGAALRLAALYGHTDIVKLLKAYA